MRMEPTLVLDGSITLAWIFEDESNAIADAVQETVVASGAIVPSLWPLEIANGLVVGERRRRITEEKAARTLVLLGALRIVVDTETSARAFREIRDLARALNLSAYDASYLELAQRL